MSKQGAFSFKKRALFFNFEIFTACILSVVSVRDNGGFILPIQIQKSEFSITMSNQLWQYLRAGLNYLEVSGKNYPPNFVHPGGVAYGPLGLSRIAVLDVIQNNPLLSKFNPEDVFNDVNLYEDFAKSYADLLLRHYLKLEYWKMQPEQVLSILQKAWFLGPGLYKQGHEVIPSREKRAQEYITKTIPTSHPST
jgi:hypothetical protein